MFTTLKEILAEFWEYFHKNLNNLKELKSEDIIEISTNIAEGATATVCKAKLKNENGPDKPVALKKFRYAIEEFKHRKVCFFIAQQISRF